MRRRLIRTSNDLLDWKPCLADDPAWSSFAEEFDKPEHIKTRSKATRAVLGPVRSGDVKELGNLCFSILHGQEFVALPFWDEEQQMERHLSREEEEAKRISEGRVLAQRVEDLVAGNEAGKRLLEAIKTEHDRADFQPDTRSIFEACKALFCFIGREERLPFKRELNLEANWIKECRRSHVLESAPEFGKELVLDIDFPDCGRMVTQAGIFHVYSFEKKGGVNDNYDFAEWFNCQLVRFDQWETPRWEAGNYRKALRDSGLRRLPEAKRGRKRGR